jgi:hypothetical protein
VGHRCSEEIFVSTGQKAKWVTDTLKISWYPQDKKPSKPQVPRRDLCIHRTEGQVGHRYAEEIFISIGQKDKWATDTRRYLCIHRTEGQVGHRYAEEIFVSTGQEAK